MNRQAESMRLSNSVVPMAAPPWRTQCSTLRTTRLTVSNLRSPVNNGGWCCLRWGFWNRPSSTTIATCAETSRHFKKRIKLATPSFRLRQRFVSRGSNRAKLGLQWLYAIDQASEVVGLGGVGLVDCRVEIGKSLAADRTNVGIGRILMRASRSLKILNQAVIICNSRERPAEAFFVHSD